MAEKRFKGGLIRGRPYRDIGEYVVPHGKHEVKFELEYPIVNVLIACPSEELPVCQGDLNWFAVTLLPRGFILHADVKSDFAEVTWVTIPGF